MPTSSKALSGRARLALHWQENPHRFVEMALGRQLWSRQRDILESVRDYRKTAVRSGHGTGKTYTAAAAMLWFLYSFPRSRVVTTATTWSQVRDLLWHEANQLWSRRRVRDLGGKILQTRLDVPDGRYAIGLSPRVGQEEAFAGHHAKHILLVFDEASGVRQPIFDVGEGYMTTEGARWLMIGNPTRPQGEFYAAFHSKRAEYATHHLSVFDSPNFTGEDVDDDARAGLVSQAWVEERRRGWGEGSMLWQIRVLGEFPAQADDAVLSLLGVEAAMERELAIHPEGERVVACDVARFGSDETVIATREDRRCRIARVYSGKPTTETSGAIIEEAGRIGASRVVVDDAGVGGGVTDQVREKGLSVTAFNGGHAAIRPDEYPNARSELWFAAGEQLLEADLESDEQLAADLVAPTFHMTSKGQREVEKKDSTKKRLGRSPDRGDAALMLYAPARRATMEWW